MMQARADDSGLLHELLFQRQDSSRIALVSPENELELSYADLCRHSRDLAIRLRQRISEPHARIALLLPACPEFVVAFFAVAKSGAIVVPLDIYTKPEELTAIVRFLDPAMVITNASLQRKLRAELTAPECCLLELGKTGLRVEFSGGPPAARPAAEIHPRVDPEDDAVFVLTSGTTGNPKAVRLSHRAIRRNIEMHLESLALEGEIVSLQVLPLNYSYGLNACCLSTLSLHGTTILTPHAIERKSIHALVERYGANLLMGSPVIFQYLLESGGDFRSLHSLRYLTVGGDRCRANVARLIGRCLPWTRCCITYGVTEAGPRVSTLAPQFFASMPHSVGCALRGVDIAIFDQAGRACAPGKPGEVALKTPSLMNGYFRDEAQTAAKFRDGWLLTGDLGRLDGGFLSLLGRRAGEFKFRGRRVNPGYIEQIMLTHPEVQEAHVSKKESAEGEALVAAIKVHLAERERLVQELKILCRRHLPASLVPSAFHFYEPHLYHFKGRPTKQISAPPPQA
jgi:long-chain acyl-CoA synthetase